MSALSEVRRSVAGHAFTIGPALLHSFAPGALPASQPWSTELEDPVVGKLTLHGRLRDLPDADTCVIVVHGLGGTPDAHYCAAAARAAERLRLSCLRLSLRGAERRGEDFYHAGLTADLAAAIASPALARYRSLLVLGYSLGGHMSLRFGLAPSDARVRAIAAVCVPLDLELCAQAIDHPRSALYRHYVLAGLKQIYSKVAQRRPVPTSLSKVLAAQTLRRWDALTVVPRFGFESVEQYYSSMSIGPHLARLAVPGLVVQVDADPMVPPWTYERHLQQLPPSLVVQRLQVGGHVGFPARIHFDTGAPGRLEEHVLDWLVAR